MNYRPDGLPHKLLAYFSAHPDEELHYADVLAKFGGSMSNAQRAVQMLSEEGTLESVHVIRLVAKGRAA